MGREFVNHDRQHIDDCDSFLKESFEFKMEDGNTFRINKVQIVYRKTLKRQIEDGGRVEIKFCLRDDEDAEGTEGVENWEMIVFPMYRNNREIAHGSMVSHFDSAVNGNLIVENGMVIDSSSNHCLAGYDELQDPVTEFAKSYLDCLLEEDAIK